MEEISAVRPNIADSLEMEFTGRRLTCWLHIIAGLQQTVPALPSNHQMIRIAKSREIGTGSF
jgi:hypothetical protein